MCVCVSLYIYIILIILYNPHLTVGCEWNLLQKSFVKKYNRVRYPPRLVAWNCSLWSLFEKKIIWTKPFQGLSWGYSDPVEVDTDTHLKKIIYFFLRASSNGAYIGCHPFMNHWDVGIWLKRAHRYSVDLPQSGFNGLSIGWITIVLRFRALWLHIIHHSEVLGIKGLLPFI